jgi:phosphopantothenoylcysteine decarboxylase/phosphopantothenate--cysteine ligase
MLTAVEAALPADIAIFAAAVADWRAASPSPAKIKKSSANAPPSLALSENPDILKTIAHMKKNRPALVIGFAAETNDVLAHARKKLKSKGADWIVANDVSPQTGIMGGDRNTVHLLTDAGVESWPEMSKCDVAAKIIERAAKELAALKRAAAE